MPPTDELSPQERAEPRRPLDREVVVAEAIRMIDAEGLEALTMRSLGARLGVEAMALYRHVNGREDLLEAIVDSLVDSIAVDPGDLFEPADGWQAFLQWMAHSVRSLAIAHPAVFPLVATRHPAAPWLRPPLRSLRVVEGFLDGLTRRGFTDAQAVEAYRVFTSFLLGHLLLEVATLGATTSPVEEPLDEGGAGVRPPGEEVSVEDFPTILRTAPLLSEDHTVEEFERSLEALLDRLDLVLSQ
ncbi:TetR/AcrR family transcriptional regulator [Phycicoccus sp. DTK01]|uniref:TetR/AcrR family transcriptional regulator n=1 Tax=Phycicoccus sp. DTK01 TaxID=2785745 RepID=UPI001A8C936C|nr:TetR/AcrR family transcriptional regulator C-terminal domain-containing protein [Phycicoccus sp. DTK01]GIL36728.1 putative transcriptional regulator, TetR family protein [Phycicoccus sp. DTK01]